MRLLHLAPRRPGRVEDREEVLPGLLQGCRLLDRLAGRRDHVVEPVDVHLHAEAREDAMVQLNVDAERLITDIDETPENLHEEAVTPAEFLCLPARKGKLIHLRGASD